MTLFPSILLQAGSSTQGVFLQTAPLVAIFAVFYLLLFLPMQKQKKAQAKMLAELKNGDTVVTSAGIIGTVTALDADTLVLRVKPDNIKLQFARSAVSSLVTSEGSK